ncbi:hypothetical protein GGG17_01585 [Arsenicicoccus sp. MKL-02]|uniref:Type I restriction modification DNA specificity domain-containing protein n=1 Tax=Arsenicicoccus cauae TaxID=2663847 RepID=A0A6I3I913_9MICO|nr:restriction endonuclease subunit S [Arsenicicoccus cauae]MTB70688.1 hypothetical protein [Arsenicicoccus cauae]
MSGFKPVRVQHLAEVVNGYPFDSERFDTSNGYPLLRIRDVGADATEIRYTGEFVEAAKVVRGDVVVGMDGDFKVGQWLGAEDALLNQRVALLRTDAITARFLLYALPQELEAINAVTYATTVKHLSASQILHATVSWPGIEGASVIVDFLDRETAKIDALVAKQDALVARLRERHRSSIAQAVEAVLDPSSGTRLKHFATEMRQGSSPQCESVPADGVTEWGVLKTGCVNGGVFRPDENKLLPADVEPRVEAVVRRGEIVISRASTKDLVGSAAVVEDEYPRLMLSDKTYAITVDPRVADPWFVSTLLGTSRMRQAIELEATGASHSMQNVSKEDLLNLPMSLPPVASQIAVTRALKEDAPKVDAMVGKAQELSANLKERRAALITAAVKGRLDVTTYGKAG